MNNLSNKATVTMLKNFNSPKIDLHRTKTVSVHDQSKNYGNKDPQIFGSDTHSNLNFKKSKTLGATTDQPSYSKQDEESYK